MNELSQYQLAMAGGFGDTAAQAELVAIDLEMTGLDPINDQIVSIGLVPIKQAQIPLVGARQKFIEIKGSVGDSAAVHGVVDDTLASALSLNEALLWFIEQTRGKVLVAHHAQLDVQFLQAKISQQFGVNLAFVAIDTLQIEKQRWLKQHEVIKEGCLRLGASRERYQLPVYSAHDALVDALACAELLIAQLNAMGDSETTKLVELAQLYR
ncbi:3'-5' exonuclease [Shewanella sp. WXL01]|uniref:3'-5' exonuclease n=2 Tax=Shewanellaceae TaxID=267890 RepID=A0A411PN46_9GAMM|nr:exonuclease domain-containing protein [Shewanella sp. WXL01]NKF52626.1 3'-5' exonuclease [Shewanella sp. WXL01]QBF84967.1 3'-5' exonuclease [Shewanella maritima]